jgi:protein involved in polysaccharide export with SLBB domain
MRVSDAVVAAGGFGEDTYLDEVHVLKYSADSNGTSLKKVSMSNVLKDYNSEENALLGPNDRVIVFSKWNFSFPDTVSIFGEVKKPDKYKMVKGMTVGDLVMQAGGFTQATFKLYVEIVRRSVRSDSVETGKIIKLDFEKNAKDGAAFILQNRDEVYIRNIIDYGKTISVKLNGLFLFPGTYSAEKGEKLSSVIKRAGGFREEAFLPGIVFSRKRVRERQQENLKIVAEKLQKQLEQILTSEMQGVTPEDKAYRDALIKQRMEMLENLKSATPLGRVVIKVKDLQDFENSDWDIKVEDGDEMTVTENLNTVSIMGEVFAPISVVYSKKNKSIGDCLSLAGGVTESGDEDNIYLLKADGTVVTPKTAGFFTCFNWIDVGPGATIIVPPKVPKKSMWDEIQKVTTIIYQLAVTTGVVMTVIK